MDLKDLVARGGLKPDDLVWHQGMAAWSPASLVKGLFPEEMLRTTGGPPNVPPSMTPVAAANSAPAPIQATVVEPEPEPELAPAPPAADPTSGISRFLPSFGGSGVDPQSDGLSRREQATMRERPLGATMTACFSVLLAIIAAISYAGAILMMSGVNTGMVLGTQRAAMPSLPTEQAGTALKALLLLMWLLVKFVAMGAVAYGLFSRQDWAYITTLIVHFVSICAGVVTLILIGSWAGVLAEVPELVGSIAVLAYFMMPGMQDRLQE